VDSLRGQDHLGLDRTPEEILRQRREINQVIAQHEAAERRKTRLLAVAHSQTYGKPGSTAYEEAVALVRTSRRGAVRA
jgi:hypothetical protein